MKHPHYITFQFIPRPVSCIRYSPTQLFGTCWLDTQTSSYGLVRQTAKWPRKCRGEKQT